MALLEGDFAIEITDRALIVRGIIPCDAMKGINCMAEERGFDLIDSHLAAKYGAIMVLTNREGSDALRAEHAASIAHLTGIERWLADYDRGTSSMTMYRAITSDRRHLGFRLDYASTPLDADDFGRCVRLLDAAPTFRKWLGLVAEKHPNWVPIIEHWDELEAMYRADEHRELCDRLSELRH